MGRDLSVKSVHVLYIGRVESAHEKLWDQLRREGLAIAFAPTQKAGLELADNLQPQVAVINTVNSHFSGERIARTLARRVPNVRRLVIAEHSRADDIPCEERLVLPFTPRKLRDLLSKLLQQAAPTLLVAGPLELDTVTRRVRGPNGEHHLTPKQCSLLSIFMERPNQVISRRDLMEQIWDTEFMGDTRTLDVHIRWLREKVEADPRRPMLLVTHRGVGYVLAVGGHNGAAPRVEPGEAD